MRWRIPFSHHPAYCAGPHHSNDEEICDELTPLFARGGARLVLAGHEHNFQLSEVDGRTYVISGAGGKVREDLPEGFDEAHTIGWSGQSHLLLVYTAVPGSESHEKLQPLSVIGGYKASSRAPGARAHTQTFHPAGACPGAWPPGRRHRPACPAAPPPWPPTTRSSSRRSWAPGW